MHKYAKCDRKVAIPHWPRVGRVDIVVETGLEVASPAWLAELKWCGPGHDVLYEAVWDLFKMALVDLGELAPRGG